ncbi:MAG TPA: aminoglycoside adenylyltransferase domain-containing protein, partial [Caulobacteraceae bacterium]|nr:aminoglycoside adenylyltransferase domain-containing protein [Caulobacteraceae bacterium]
MPHLSSPAPAWARAPAIEPAPTPYADLNAILAELTDGVRRTLGEVFVGAYLQGSLALGDADEASDVDFLVVTARDVTPDELAALQVLHGAIHALPSPWATKLDGSYAPAPILKRLKGQPRDPPGEPRGDDWADPGLSGLPPRVYPLLYLTNGSKTLVRSEHDNTEVVRWVTREAGITLAGPSPKALIDPVPADTLRAESLTLLETVLRLWLDEGQPMDQHWLQVFLAGFAARVLHTLRTGRITSKKAAADWAAGHLDARWRPLLEATQASRALSLESRLGPADPAAVEETLAFLRYIRGRAILERKMLDKRHGGGGGPHAFRGDGPGRPALRPGGGPAKVRPG